MKNKNKKLKKNNKRIIKNLTIRVMINFNI